MSTHTITMKTSEMLALKAQFPKAEIRKTPPYALYQIRISDCMITAYESGKVVFQGNGADFYAESLTSNTTKKNTTTTKRNIERFPQAGSDEVGTGDYFGPVVVVAAYVPEEEVEYLRSLGIQDSKAINDTRIRELGPILVERLQHSLLILDNRTYNRIHPDNNMVAIKCKLHNQAYVHLQKKITTLPSLCVVDQFVQKTSYYRYVKEEHTIIKGLHFETKAENKYLSVACASIIARYAFLLQFDVMSKKYAFSFLKGAGYKVDQNIRDFVKQHSALALEDVAKLHFANTDKALKRK